MKIYDSVLDLIGHTPLVRLNRIKKDIKATIGANIFASLKVAREFGEEKTVVTVVSDSGMKYLSTELFHHNPEVCTIHCCTLEKPEMREECQKGAARCCVLEPCYEE